MSVYAASECLSLSLLRIVAQLDIDFRDLGQRSVSQ